MISAGAGPWIYPEFRNRGSRRPPGPHPAPASRGEGEGLREIRSRLIRRVIVFIPQRVVRKMVRSGRNKVC